MKSVPTPSGRRGFAHWHGFWGLARSLAALRTANARLRQVVQAKDTEIAARETGQARQAELIRKLELRVAELERQLTAATCRPTPSQCWRNGTRTPSASCTSTSRFAR
jgi:hypothetical protein